ncbi:MAG: hypothetical protein AUJ12_10235 [Alphaproteobacteria bacterium CG1_02_46_17]|nr:MAG: hypothetical protein AUJ12_10235 [Alphaproteobacteria bacterium CG1_02_46_17]
MQKIFNIDWNSHYDFDSLENQVEIKKIESYDPAKDPDAYATGGGDVIPSPWGENQSLDAGIYDDGFEYKIDPSDVINPEELKKISPHPKEFCEKRLVVNPGNMLSLQRHKARQEYWAVRSGILTVILDGQEYEVKPGQAIFIPQGGVHCMNNIGDEPVEVIELQTGITREKDNVRLIDFSNRPTYPLTSENEFASAKLYANLQNRIAHKFGTQNFAHSSFLPE